jgi:hypothetical protein
MTTGMSEATLCLVPVRERLGKKLEDTVKTV